MASFPLANVTPTYTQLGANARAPPPGGSASNYSATAQTAVWPQWTPTSDSAVPQGGATGHTQATAGSGTHNASQGSSSTGHGGSTQQQQEEFSDMLRMLDNSGTGFTDLSGMFNSFNE